MNIFVLSDIPSVAAAMHCDKHVNKMLVESVQLLSTCWHTCAPDEIKVIQSEFVVGWTLAPLYKPYQPNHPCNVWVRESAANYRWLHTLAHYLAAQYRRRTGKVHATARMLAGLYNPPATVPQIEQTPFALVMPEKYRKASAVDSYRAYYRAEKFAFAKWTNVETPYWFKA